MQNLIFLATAFVIVSLILFVRGARKLYKRKLVSGFSQELSAVLLMSIASIFLLLASNLYTYQRLVYERPVAEISFTQLRPQYFQASITSADGAEKQVLDVYGDEWQLDAQVLIWKGVATLLGLDASYRLHRLSGRYLDINQARTESYSVHSLVSPRTIDTSIAGSWDVDSWTLDIWQYAHRHDLSEQLVDAAFGSAVFLPMADNATYDIAISRTGLVARPSNDAAKEAVNGWLGWLK